MNVHYYTDSQELIKYGIRRCEKFEAIDCCVGVTFFCKNSYKSPMYRVDLVIPKYLYNQLYRMIGNKFKSGDHDFYMVLNKVIKKYQYPCHCKIINKDSDHKVEDYIDQIFNFVHF